MTLRVPSVIGHNWQREAEACIAGREGGERECVSERERERERQGERESVCM